VIVLGISSYGAAWNNTGHMFTGAIAYGAAIHYGAVNQASKISIQNFQVVDVSSGELRVTVDYTYPDAVQGKVLIHASPEEAGGIFNPLTAEFDELPVQSGTHTVTLAITKNSTGPVFTSVAVRVCISAPGGALLCRDFPHEKTWTNGAAQRCSISGRLLGRLEGLSRPDHAGPPIRVSLRQMVVESPDGKRRSAPISTRSYTFSNLDAGVEYKVFPSGFESQPRRTTVPCRANSRHRADFRIVRPTPEG